MKVYLDCRRYPQMPEKLNLPQFVVRVGSVDYWNSDAISMANSDEDVLKFCNRPQTPMLMLPYTRPASAEKIRTIHPGVQLIGSIAGTPDFIKPEVFAAFHALCLPWVWEDSPDRRIMRDIISTGKPLYLYKPEMTSVFALYKKFGDGITGIISSDPLDFGARGIALHPNYQMYDARSLDLDDLPVLDFPGITRWNIKCYESWCRGVIPDAPVFL